MQILKTLIDLYHSELTILHIADDNHLVQKQEQEQEQEQEQNKTFFNSSFPDATHEYIDVNTKEMFSVIKQYLSNNNINLLATMSEKHSFLECLFTKHTVETFAFNIKQPFLVMHSLKTD